MRLTTLRTDHGLRPAFATALGGIALDAMDISATALRDAIDISSRAADGGIVTLLDGWRELRPQLLRLAEGAETQAATRAGAGSPPGSFWPPPPPPRPKVRVSPHHPAHAAHARHHVP